MTRATKLSGCSRFPSFDTNIGSPGDRPWASSWKRAASLGEIGKARGWEVGRSVGPIVARFTREQKLQAAAPGPKERRAEAQLGHRIPRGILLCGLDEDYLGLRFKGRWVELRPIGR